MARRQEIGRLTRIVLYAAAGGYARDIEEVLTHSADNRAAWVAARIDERLVVVPLDGASAEGDRLTVRYVGAATVLSGVLVTLAVLRRAAVRVGARALLAFGVAAALSPAIWIAHAARSANPDLLGPRAAAHDSAVARAGLPHLRTRRAP